MSLLSLVSNKELEELKIELWTLFCARVFVSLRPKNKRPGYRLSSSNKGTRPLVMFEQRLTLGLSFHLLMRYKPEQKNTQQSHIKALFPVMLLGEADSF